MFNYRFVEKHQCQHHKLSSPNSHESAGILIGRLELQFGCAALAMQTTLAFANFG